MPSTGSAPGGSSSAPSNATRPSSSRRKRPTAEQPIRCARPPPAQPAVELDRGRVGDRQVLGVVVHPVERPGRAPLRAAHAGVVPDEAQLGRGGEQLRSERGHARARVHAARVAHLGERGAQAVERRDRVRREDGGAAAAERARVGGVGADEGHVHGTFQREEGSGRLGSGSLGSGAALRASTKLAAAVARSSAATSSRSTVPGTAVSPSSAPTRAARRRSRSTFSSIAASLTRPSRTASTSASPHGLVGPGIARSSAALPAGSARRRARTSRR